MNAPAQRTFAFGRFRFDAIDGKLLLDGGEIPLPPRERQLLAIFVENPDVWLQEDWLSRSLWPKAVPPKDELDHLVRELRLVLERGADGVATVQGQAGRGYRFLFPVRATSGVAVPAAPRPSPIARPGSASSQPAVGAHRRLISPQRFLGALVVAALLAGALGWGLSWATRRAEREAPDTVSSRDPATLRAAANAELAKGESAARGHDLPALREAIVRFEAALAVEPGYARARAALALALVRSGEFARARREAEAAIALDARLADAHAALAFARLFVDWNAVEARAAAERALALDLAHVAARRALAWTHAAEGDFVEARAQLLQARSAQGFDIDLALDQGRIEFFAGRTEAARRLLAEVVRREPAAIAAHETLAAIHLAERRLGAAALELELVDALAAGATRTDERVRLAAVGGWEPPDPGEAARLLRARADEVAAAPRDSAWIATASGSAGGRDRSLVAARIFAQFEDRELALDAIERALARRESGGVLVWVEPSFAPLRGFARFREAMARAGIAAPAPKPRAARAE